MLSLSGELLTCFRLYTLHHSSSSTTPPEHDVITRSCLLLGPLLLMARLYLSSSWFLWLAVAAVSCRVWIEVVLYNVYSIYDFWWFLVLLLVVFFTSIFIAAAFLSFLRFRRPHSRPGIVFATSIAEKIDVETPQLSSLLGTQVRGWGAVCYYYFCCCYYYLYISNYIDVYLHRVFGVLSGGFRIRFSFSFSFDGGILLGVWHWVESFRWAR